MNSLKKFLLFWQSIVIFAGLYFEKWAEQYFVDEAQGRPALLTLVTFLGLVVLIKCLDYPFAKGVEKSRKLRRMILGDAYIEGVWFNKVKSGEENRYGLLNIEYQDESICVHGEQYDESGNLKSTWHSVMSTYREKDLNLTYAYEANYFLPAGDKQVSTIQGISSIRFLKTPAGGSPNTYEGSYEDSVPVQEKHFFLGAKVDSSEMLKMLANSKKGAIQQLVKEYDK